jgi:hypothetical protein
VLVLGGDDLDELYVDRDWQLLQLRTLLGDVVGYRR